jgi:putative aminopeptidase FrvX
MEKTGDIYVTSEKGRCVAYWHPVDGSSRVFLCAMDKGTYNKHPHLRKMLSELALEIAINRGREAGASMTFRVREPVVESRSRWM